VLGIRGRLVGALLYAGPGAALSHQTSAWHWRLIDVEPRRIHVSTTNHTRSLAEIRVHRPRNIESELHDGLSVTTVPRTLLDLAASLSFSDLRRALAEADHLNLLDPAQVHAQLGRGRPGASALRKALSLHCPELAQTRSVLEEQFLTLVERAGLRIPEVNPRLEGFVVDALWRTERVVVELDGHASHAKPAAVERDRRRDLLLRTAGFAVRRYTWRQVTREPHVVVADLRAAIERRRPDGGADP
jgi:very-short-patch-repair endonuclease